MGYCVVMTITAALVVLSGSQVNAATGTYQACRKQGEKTFLCNSSLILITNVTKQTKENDLLLFENLKRDCMGKDVCDPSRVCETAKRQPLTVHYMCVDKTYIRSSSCNRQTERMTDNFGYIQSPGYPAATGADNFCSWEIDLPADKAVVILLHDVVIKNHQGNCESTFVVSGPSCQEDKRDIYLCGKDNFTSLTRCGKTNISFRVPSKNNEMRFWLSFCVLQKDQISTFLRSPLVCPTVSDDVNYGQAPGTNGQDSNTEVLVIMLSIISGISAVLLIILIVICVRCRLIQASGSESVYSDPSPSVQPHYEFVSTSDVEKTRPQLADGYFEVADALPFVQRVEPPTSPPYAEVEHVADIRKVLCLAVSDEHLNDSTFEERQGGHFSASSQPKRGALSRLKGDSITGKYLNTTSNTGPQIIPTCVGKKTVLKYPPVSSQTVQKTESDSEYEVCSGYESIGKSRADKTCLQSNKRTHPDPGELSSDMPERNISTTENCSKMLHVVSGNSKPNSNIDCDGDAATRFPYTTDHTYFVLSKSKQAAGHDESEPSDRRARSKSLPTRNCTTCLPTSEAKKHHKRAAYRNKTPPSGIVRNGIMKFEQNST